jgi:tetratricopeptide (TPR) repeat protein
MKLPVILSLLIISSVEASFGQNAYVRLGRQSFMDGDFKAAIQQLEKGCMKDSSDVEALWMLGYSYYHSDNYKKSIIAYTKVISIKPTDASAYYYRARAKAYMAKDSQLPFADKERFMLGAIFDFTKAIEINTDPTDTKLYQNRAIAYQDYAMFKLQPTPHVYDKARSISSLKASINDFEKVLSIDGSRSDISQLLDVSKAKLAEVSGTAAIVAHH